MDSNKIYPAGKFISFSRRIPNRLSEIQNKSLKFKEECMFDQNYELATHMSISINISLNASPPNNG